MLSLEEKVGQMMMVGFAGLSPPKYIVDWLASGRISGIYLFARNIASPAQVKQLIDECRAAASTPILVGIDQEGGIVARLHKGFTESPGAMALGASRDYQLAEDIAYMMGRELAALGINWNFAPVADIAHQLDNPSVSTRSVGADKQLVSQMVAAQIRGFQRAGIAATVKHFPGLGNTVIDTHHALARVAGSLEYLYEHDLVPFRDAIRADVACVMLTHVIYDELDGRHPATLSPRVVTGLLRQELGYEGAVCTDCMEMNAITRGFGAGEAAVLAVLAGIDMPLYSHKRSRQESAYKAVLKAAKSGRIPPNRIDESVARIQALKAKYALGDRPALDVVACEAHLSLAIQAARSGTVMVKRGAAWPVEPQTANIALVEFASRRASDAVDQTTIRQFSTILNERIAQATCHLLNPSTKSNNALEQDLRSSDLVILVTRNAHLHPAQLQLAQRIIDDAKRVILICARNRYDAGMLSGADTVICANGDSPPSLHAVVEALLGDYTPAGNLTVPLS